MKTQSKSKADVEDTIDDLVSDMRESETEIESHKSLMKEQLKSERGEMLDYLSTNESYFTNITVDKSSRWKKFKNNIKNLLL